MCGAPLKSIRKQLLPGVVFKDNRNITWTVVSLNSDLMTAKLKYNGPVGGEVITCNFRGSSDDSLSKFIMLTFPKELRLEDVL